MTENELSLKVAELMLATKHDSLWSDLIKVGIPSFVAIVSAVVTYLITVKNNHINIEIAQLNKSVDEKIEKIKIEHEKQKSISERKHKLIEQIAENVTLLYDASTSYLLSVKGKRRLEDNGERISDLYEERLVSDYNKAGNALLNYHKKTESLALLLSDEETIKWLKKLHGTIVDMYTNCGLECNTDVQTLNKHTEYLDSAVNNLFSALSKLYLTT